MELEPAEIARYMRMGADVPQGALAKRVDELWTEAHGLLRPARVWRRVPLPLSVTSPSLERHLAGCRSAYLVCGTIGAGLDAMLRRVSVSSAADALIVQAIGAAAVEKWMDMVETEIAAELGEGEHLVSRYSPGYGDWPLEAQQWLLGVLDSARAIGVSLTDSLLMAPSKSVSAVIGVLQDDAGRE